MNPVLDPYSSLNILFRPAHPEDFDSITHYFVMQNENIICKAVGVLNIRNVIKEGLAKQVVTNGKDVIYVHKFFVVETLATTPNKILGVADVFHLPTTSEKFKYRLNFNLLRLDESACNKGIELNFLDYIMDQYPRYDLDFFIPIGSEADKSLLRKAGFSFSKKEDADFETWSFPWSRRQVLN